MAGDGLSSSEHLGVPLLSIRNLTTTFSTIQGPLVAVNDVSLDVDSGTTVGLVGESGSGKSALVRSVMNLLAPNGRVADESRIVLQGRDIRRLPGHELNKIWGRRIGIVFQDPMTSLNPVKKIGSHITEITRWHLGHSKQQARAHAIDLLDRVGIPDPRTRIDQYPHELSGGMRQRVGIAAALCCFPRLLIADEPTTALDVTVQRQILELLRTLQQEHEMGMILISHDLGTVAQYTDRVAVMYAGQIVESCNTDDLYHATRHPYTEALLRSIPRPSIEGRHELVSIPGAPPNLLRPPSGCRFHARCDRVQSRCVDEEPELIIDSGGHAARCHFPIESLAVAVRPTNTDAESRR